MESVLDKLTKMNEVLRRFQNEQYGLVEPTRQVRWANSVVSWYSTLAFVVIVSIFAASLFRIIEFSGELASVVIVPLIVIALTIHIWNYLDLRNKAICKECGSKLELAEGDWVDFDTQSRRNVVFFCRECKSYFYTVEEQSSSDGDGD